jgi:DNA-directed RNA polymerase specialized sigma24 family protein
MHDDDSSSRSRKSRTPQPTAESLGDSGTGGVPPREPPESRLALIDWEKLRAMAYKITAQINALKDVECAVRQQLLAMADSEWEGIEAPQDVALSLTHVIAAQYPIEKLQGDDVRQFIFSITHRLSSTGPITQAVKYEMLRMGPADWDRVENPETHLHTMVRYAALEWLKRENAPQVTVSARLRAILVPGNDRGAVAIRGFAGRDVELILKDLPPEVREVFVRHEAWGYSIQEIADQMRIDAETAKRCLAEAVAKCSDLEGYQETRGRRRGLRRLFMPKEDK